MHLILTGATGLIGTAVLDAMINMKDVTKISILSRKPVKMAEDANDPRINVIIHNDFEKYDGICSTSSAVHLAVFGHWESAKVLLERSKQSPP